jgi:hypothetical protein
MVVEQTHGGNAMSDHLTDDQISLLCKIGEHETWKIHGDDKSDLQRLLSEGYVESQNDDSGPTLRITGKALTFLSERGVGLNEA